MRWAKASAIAVCEPVTNDAKKAVIVVPTLAPSKYGYICVIVNTPAPISGTTNDVVIEEDCTKAVKIIPRKKDNAGVRKMYRWKNFSTFESTNDFKTFTIKKSAKNKNSIAIIAEIRPESPVKWIIHSDTGFVIIFKGEINAIPPKPVNIDSKYNADLDMTPKYISIGSKTATAQTLKKSCSIEPVKARLNSSPRVICPIETKIFVTEVPILAPIIIGMAASNESIGVPFPVPTATNPTIIEVVVDEDCTIAVVRTPIMRAITGFDVD